MLKDVRNQSYSSNWAPFAILNTYYYSDIDSGIEFYQSMIDKSQKHESELFEMLFRLLLVDLYHHAGMTDKAAAQLTTLGIPDAGKWLSIGPFENIDGFRKKFQPEKTIQFSKEYKHRGKILKWQHIDDGFNDGFINFRDIYTDYIWSVGYSLIDIISTHRQKVQFRFGADDGEKIWLNGKEIWKFNKAGPAIFDDKKVDVTLKKGRNRILIKVCNTVGDWGFFFRVTDSEGRSTAGIKYISPDNTDKIL